jgi:hypothetical protein
MKTFGQKLKCERQEQGLSLEQVAEATRIELHHLRALEWDDFDGLPGDTEVKGFLRAYAERLGVDADLMFEDYVRERASRAGGYRLSAVLAASGIAVALVAFGTWWLGFRDTTEPRETFSVMAAAPVTERETPSPPAVTPVVAEKPGVVVPLETEPAPTPEPVTVPEPVAEATVLTIPDLGVGTAVEDRQLVGESDRFTEGQQVWFWTRVRGGTPGETIEHVWYREGVEATRVTLTLGGSHWRTHSGKMLWPESAGDWAVEARDGDGRLLARREFVCVR